MRRELHLDAPHAAGGGRDHQRVVGPDPQVLEHFQRGRTGEVQPAGRLPVNAAGLGHDLVRRNVEVAGVGAGPHVPDHIRTHADRRNVLADRGDDAREVATRAARPGVVGPGLLAPVAQEHLHVVDARGDDLDAHLVGAGSRQRERMPGENVGIPVAGVAVGECGGRLLRFHGDLRRGIPDDPRGRMHPYDGRTQGEYSRLRWMRHYGRDGAFRIHRVRSDRKRPWPVSRRLLSGAPCPSLRSSGSSPSR